MLLSFFTHSHVTLGRVAEKQDFSVIKVTMSGCGVGEEGNAILIGYKDSKVPAVTCTIGNTLPNPHISGQVIFNK